MLAFQIKDTRDFMKKLLTGDTFDAFVLSEGQVTTFTTFRVDGSWHPAYFEDDPLKKEKIAEAGAGETSRLTWSLLRPHIFNLIRGKHTPSSFKFVLKLSQKELEHLLEESGQTSMKEQVSGLFLNISYNNGAVTCISGTSVNVFPYDKSLDRLWDSYLERFLAKGQMGYELMA